MSRLYYQNDHLEERIIIRQLAKEEKIYLDFPIGKILHSLQQTSQIHEIKKNVNKNIMNNIALK